MRRKRKHVNLTQKLAATLACLMPQAERDVLRAARAPAEVVLARFQFHHVVYHAPPFNGSDKWWNLHPMPNKAHRERSGRDTSAIAKVKRLRDAPAVAAGKPKPKAAKHRAAKGRTRDRPARSWGIPGLRRKLNGEVVRT